MFKKPRVLFFALTLGVMVGLGSNLGAQSVMLSGHTPGVYTMDYSAALAYAKANNKLVFIDFTGSDWCYWCQLMQSSVFTKTEWLTYARENLVLVTIDFPEDQSIVPGRFKTRNDELSEQFGVEGYPTYVVLDSDGTTELGRLGAGQGKTPNSFIGELRPLAQRSKVKLQAFAQKLTGQSLTDYRAALTQVDNARLRLSKTPSEINRRSLDAAFTRVLNLQTNYLLSRMTAGDRARYQELSTSLVAATSAMDTWLATEPIRSTKNDLIYQGHLDGIARIETEQRTLLQKYQ